MTGVILPHTIRWKVVKMPQRLWAFHPNVIVAWEQNDTCYNIIGHPSLVNVGSCMGRGSSKDGVDIFGLVCNEWCYVF